MKRSNIKKSLMLGMFILASSLFLWNCEQDITEKTDAQEFSETNFKRSIVSEHYLKAHQPEIYQALKKNLGTKDDGSKNQYSEEYSFEYDLDRVQIIETENFTQYSLLVIGSGTDGTHFENYFLMLFIFCFF